MTDHERKAEDARKSRRKDFIARHYHRLNGMLLDAAIAQRRGAELSIWLRNVCEKDIAWLLGDAFDELYPGPPIEISTQPNGGKK